jgi:hypothetical protein
VDFFLKKNKLKPGKFKIRFFFGGFSLGIFIKYKMGGRN